MDQGSTRHQSAAGERARLPQLQGANGARAHQHSGQGPVPGRTRQQQTQQDPTCTFQERSKQQTSPVALRGQLLEVLTYQKKLDVEEFLS